MLETDEACDIVVLPLDGSGWPVRVSSGADYTFDPTWSPDGRMLAWHEWDFPNMPWDGSRIAVRALDGDRPVGAVRLIAGGDSTGVSQPHFSPDGKFLAFVSDQTGWANVWIAEMDGTGGAGGTSFSVARPLCGTAGGAGEPFEHAEPTWGPGQRSYAWSPDSSAIALCRNEGGFGRLLVADLAGGATRELAKGWHQGLDWAASSGIGSSGPGSGVDGGSGGSIVALRSGARTPHQVVCVDPADGSREVLAVGVVAGFAVAEVTEPEAVSWKASDDSVVHGLFWKSKTTAVGAQEKPPLLVQIHGGPTSQAVAGWVPRVHYWVERGWSVLAPNYRGSTGYGRTYAQSLAGGWGELDVEDTVAGIRHVINEGWCDPERVVVSGGSAGGLTVLLICALHGDLVRAGVSLFGVTDLLGLAETTHRFESRYLDRIVGELPKDADRYRERSPITHVERITTPLLVLQGDEDKAVPKAQADALVEALRQRGVICEYHVYEGEGHGWRRPETIADELDRTEQFFERWVLRPAKKRDD